MPCLSSTTKRTKAMHTTYLALGSNLGNRRQLMARAIELIGREVGTV